MIRTTTVRAAAALTAVALVSAACSGGGTTGAASPQSPPSTGSGSAPGAALPFAGAPKVSSPLPASVLAGDPCADALTPAQVEQAIGAEVAGKPGSTAGVGATCSWFNSATLGKVFVGYDTQTRSGLSSVYRNTQPKSPVWRPIADLGGFPAVAHSDNTDHDCQVSVGLADDLAVDVGGFLGDSKRGQADACDVTAQMAGLVVETLKKRPGA